jgi:hypothetical protein
MAKQLGERRLRIIVNDVTDPDDSTEVLYATVVAQRTEDELDDARSALEVAFEGLLQGLQPGGTVTELNNRERRRPKSG